MRLALKFTLAFLIGICLVLAVYAYSILRHDVATYTTDMRQDQHVLGSAMAQCVRSVWQRAGEAAALDVVRRTNLGENPNRVSVRWIWIDPHRRTDDRLPISDEMRARLRNGEDVTSDYYASRQIDRFYTLVPVEIAAVGLGAVEVSESLDVLREYRRAALLRILIATGAVVTLTGLLAAVLGFRFVGQPVDMLISHARSVAAGNLTGRLRFRQHDELRELAEELNIMSGQLAVAQQRLAAETSARIATIEQLRHADRLTTVGQLASGVAHELGTPLNVVWARADMIRSGKVNGDKVVENARIIVGQSERMTRIIRQLLDFAKPSSPRRVSMDMGQLVRQIAVLFKPMADKGGVAIRIDEASGPVSAEVDPDQIQQVLSNLVLNGIQAMPNPGTLTIAVGTERLRPPADHGGPEDEYIRLSVQDQGEGIPEANLPHVFEPFFTTKQVGEGTGLGLSVSRGIIREHRGWISVTSRMGEGSCFSVYLPSV